MKKSNLFTSISLKSRNFSKIHRNIGNKAISLAIYTTRMSDPEAVYIAHLKADWVN